jgi:UDP-N-acetylmuramoyl-L-alanyl-D-glutamate--2,6-diaminopimelate ligase
VRFSQLLAPLAVSPQLGDPEISAITPDSREVGPGALFVAVPGFASDGHSFIPAAVASGAAALLVQTDHLAALPRPPLPFAVVDDTRAALAAAAAAFHGFPAHRLRIAGITGTDGKTTTAYLTDAVLRASGHRTGLFGTVAYRVGDRWLKNPGRLTTPGAPEVQALLAEMVAAGVEYGILESTSHGLALHRLDYCEYDIAVFTNLSPDHLDLHGTFEAYRAAKARLFEMLDQPSVKAGRRYAVLNADDPTSAYMRSRTRADAVCYGVTTPADFSADEIELRADGSGFRLRTPSESVRVELPLPGRFNISNALAAAAVGFGEGMDAAQIAAAFARFSGVPGRMERIDSGQPFTVIVDYAHTGDALQKVLSTLRPLTPGRILVVFGSAGERGHTRREAMARAAAAGADFSVLTDEDPRFEDPEAILDEIAAGLRSNGKRELRDFVRVLDRQQAIRAAFQRARRGDLVLLAGKGHEQSIEQRGEACPWDEREAARRALAELGYVRP